MKTIKTIAIIGGGPRGLAVAEQLGVLLRKAPSRPGIHVVLIDDHEPGGGRIWRKTQNQHLLMNTVVSQVTMYSGLKDEMGTRPGHGPSLYEWMRTHSNSKYACTHPNAYAPRHVYGEYLNDVLHSLIDTYPAPHRLSPVLATVQRVDSIRDGSYRLYLDDGSAAIDANAIVLATGHAKSLPSSKESTWIEQCSKSERCHFHAGDAAADLPLQDIRTNETVGIIGLGLGFHDILAVLTSGRGGYFEEQDGRLIYRASGREPRIIAGSRSGLPIPARGLNQKAHIGPYKPSFFHAASIEATRLLAQSAVGGAALSFHQHLKPLIVAEVEHVYYATWQRSLHGEHSSLQFQTDHLHMRDPRQPMPEDLLRRHGLSHVARIDLAALAHPFSMANYESAEAFRNAWLAYLKNDLKEALAGNVDSPLKAALDVLRDVRDVLRSAVEFDGLNEKSLVEDFRGEFSPLCGLLAAGPPPQRILELLALEEAGLISIVGPDMEIEFDTEADAFQVQSPHVQAPPYMVTSLVDSRVPFPDLARSENELLKSLSAKGLVSPYRHLDKLDLLPGGINLLPGTFEVIGADGRANPRVFAIGLPTEGARWFTQVGSATPGSNSRFTQDATAVASGVLAAVTELHVRLPAVVGEEAAA